MSFRLQLILGIAAIEAGALLVLILSGLNLLQSSNEEELLKRASTTAQLFATTIKDAILSTDLASLESSVNELLTNTGIVYARVKGQHNVVFAQAGEEKALARPFVADRHYREVTDNIFDTYADIVVAGTPYGRVEIGFSIAAIKDVLAMARKKALAIGISGMLLVAIFSFFLGLYLTRGLKALEEASYHISTGELGYQVKVPREGELAKTAQAFNEMSRKLQIFYNERKQVEQELQHQYLHDSLTNLPNRTLLRDRLQQAILLGQRENKPLALLMMDLDRFKEINDSLGHYNGDLVLQEMAVRLRGVLRQSDTVARLGGDEFAFLLPAVKDQASAILTAEKIMNIVEQPLTLEGQTLHVTASLGIALFPMDGEDADLLISRGDIAMYAAKGSKTGYTVYQPELEQYSLDRFVLQTELRRAIQENRQLVLHYQPKVDFKTNCVRGVESLIRWEHPRHGLMFPDDFIPLAEETDLITPLTYWVLEESLRQCRDWHQAKRNLSISVNISMINLQDPEFPKRVAEILQNTGINPSFLELEITETAIMANPARAIQCVTQLNNMGIQITIDDFGVGYSSMAYLKKLPVSKIKVDKSFVMDMASSKSDEIIVRSIIGLGHNLGLHVVAEGVESKEIWEQLKQLECDSAQGYGISRPIPLEKLDNWLQDSPWSINSG